MSLFNYLDEQTNKNQSQDESFMGMETLWEQMKKPAVDAGLLGSGLDDLSDLSKFPKSPGLQPVRDDSWSY